LRGRRPFLFPAPHNPSALHCDSDNRHTTPSGFVATATRLSASANGGYGTTVPVDLQGPEIATSSSSQAAWPLLRVEDLSTIVDPARHYRTEPGDAAMSGNVFDKGESLGIPVDIAIPTPAPTGPVPNSTEGMNVADDCPADVRDDLFGGRVA